MTFSGRPAALRPDFRDAANAFLTLVRQVPGNAWDRPGLGVWTVRELTGHTTRAVSTVEDYLTQPAGAAPAAVSLGAAADTEDASRIDAVSYFRRGTQAGLTNSDAVADRGREAGRALGDRPVDVVEEMLERVLRLVDSTADDVVLASRFGTMRLVDYLPTRTFELVVHSLDLQTALGLPLSAPPGPLASTLDISTELAIQQGIGPRMILALTGRRPLPENTCIL